MPCTVKKTYQGHVNKNYSVGGCFGVLRSMRKLTITSHGGGGGGSGDDDDDGGEDEYQDEQWEESDRVAFVTSASEDGDIVLWDVKSKDILQRLTGVHQGVCFWVDVHGETGTMVSCGQDGRIVIFRHRSPEVEEVSLKVNGNGIADEQHHHSTTRYREEAEDDDDNDAQMIMPEHKTQAVLTNGHGYADATPTGGDADDASVLPSNEGDLQVGA